MASPGGPACSLYCTIAIYHIIANANAKINFSHTKKLYFNRYW